jgi:PLP dependent protein
LVKYVNRHIQNFVMNDTNRINVVKNFHSVAERVESACARSNRDPKDVEILSVIKYAENENILAFLKSFNDAHVAESRVQDAIKRWEMPEFEPYRQSAKKHFIGHLQSNKVKKAVEFFDFIDSVDSFKTATLINNHALPLEKKMGILIQVKLTESPNQSGVSLTQAPALLELIAQKCSNLIPLGYMGIAPISENPEELRPLFKEIKARFDKDFGQAKDSKRYLSLGMTNDFEVAVEEGSNLPRIGSAIFS